MPGLWVKHSSRSAAVARDGVRAAFDIAGVGSEDTYEASLLVSELVTNAVRHAPALPSGHLAVRWTLLDGGCTIAVTDGGHPAELRPGSASPTEASGRGLAILSTLAENWGVDTAQSGTTVWATYRFSSAVHLAGASA